MLGYTKTRRAGAATPFLRRLDSLLRPKTITGFQTHTTPVLLAMGEKAELASDENLPLSTLIEGVVILRKNPDHVPETKTEKKK